MRESWLAGFTQGAFAPGYIISKHTSASKQNSLTHSSFSQLKHKMHPTTSTICPAFLNCWSVAKPWFRGLFLLGYPHDSRAICFIRFASQDNWLHFFFLVLRNPDHMVFAQHREAKKKNTHTQGGCCGVGKAAALPACASHHKQAL